MRDIAPGELTTIGIDVQDGRAVLGDGLVGYGYVAGELTEPTLEQHAALIERSRSLGRYLTAAEVASVVGADGGHDAHE